MDVDKYNKKIDQYEDTYLNKEQKNTIEKLMKILIDSKKSNNYELDNFFNFLTQRVKTGFTFDEVPKEFNGYISLPKEDKKFSFKGSDNYNNLNHLLFIGENYDVLKNLLITHKNKIDIIYIDPPYNTDSAKSDGNFLSSEQEKNNTNKFIYRDKFSRTGWLNMMKERLTLAKDLLSEEGVIFISIDDNEQAYLKVLMDEIFGEENFICNFIWKKSSGGKHDSKFIVIDTEYILFFSKNKDKLKLRGIKNNISNYKYKDNNGYYNLEQLDRGSLNYQKSLDYEITDKDGNKYYPKNHESFLKRTNGAYTLKDWCWRWSKDKIKKDVDKLVYKNGKIFTKTYYFIDKENPYRNIIDFVSNRNANDEIKNLFDERIFTYPKPTKLIKYLINLVVNNKNSIVLDFFAGSGTTGHAVIELNREDNGNRQFILVTNNENNIAEDICYERLYRVINGKGTKEEKNFKWIEKNKPYLNNNLRVFNLEKIKVTPDIKLNDFLIKKIDEYKKINPEYKTDFNNIFYDLSSLEQSLKEE